ncbi:RNA polymerase sigma factor SigJ, partial [Streptosporangium saharense]|uniref:RNA polymerase sigma factor SigJ n=1 Tax=Streptosporangium saharense TaxID=1706840 RepID=UPI003322EFE8
MHEASEVFADHRELLFSVVHNMLGTVGDTEDALQETWLAWAARDVTGVDNPRAYLVRVAVNQALAHQSALRRRKETYLGPWLPEPLVTTPDAAEPAVRAESVSIALLVVLETLTPLERAVFVLHEVFAYPHTEIAAMLDRSPAAIRQLAHRAREHVQARRPRVRIDRRTHREVTERFVQAAFGGDLPALMEMLAPDVVLWPDGGGKSTAGGPRPIRGRDKVARVVVANAHGGVDVRYRQTNGDPSVVIFTEDAPLAVMVLDLDANGEQVRDIYVVSNPDKLGSIKRDPEPSGVRSPLMRVHEVRRARVPPPAVPAFRSAATCAARQAADQPGRFEPEEHGQRPRPGCSAAPPGTSARPACGPTPQPSQPGSAALSRAPVCCGRRSTARSPSCGTPTCWTACAHRAPAPSRRPCPGHPEPCSASRLKGHVHESPGAGASGQRGRDDPRRSGTRAARPANHESRAFRWADPQDVTTLADEAFAVRV